LKRVCEQVIVITGASSGIGLTTARMAARLGARVVAAARSKQTVQQLADEITGSGGEAIGVVADVGNLEDVQRIARAALDRFGGFDTWVNNAGVGIHSEILKTPIEDERRLFETNYWGTVYGSRVAAEHLRGRGGAIINIGSVASDRAVPQSGAYSASKHAVKAYTDAFRTELEVEGAPISITLIKPTATATPFFEREKVYTGDRPSDPSLMYAPEEVARAILHAAETPVRDLLIGRTAPVMSALGRLAPSIGDRVAKRRMTKMQQSSQPKRPGDSRGLEEPATELRERGEYESRIVETSAYTRAAMHPMLTGAVVAGARLAVALLLNRSKSGRRHQSAPGSPNSAAPLGSAVP